MSSITIDNLDAEVLERLRAEADRRGMDISAVVKELLKDGLRPIPTNTPARLHHDLDALAGTWSDEAAEAFLSAVADFEQIDEELWK